GMRLTLIVVLCLLNAGCAIWRKDQAEPVDNQGPRKEDKAKPEEKPSDVLKPRGLRLASPVSDRFYVRGTYFNAKVESLVRIDPTVIDTPGSLLSGEQDLGLDDQIDQARIEFDFRLGERNHVRVDYFKVDRFAQVVLAEPILFGDALFGTGVTFRTHLDWRTLGLTYTYSFFKSDRFEAGVGIGMHLLEGHLSGFAPGTNSMQKQDNVGIVPTAAINAAYRISKRWAVTLRAQGYDGKEYSNEDGDWRGEMYDYHFDVQYRWRKNFAVGLGYSSIENDLLVEGQGGGQFNLKADGPELFFRASF
ncbi:MAG TPA: hypothetical protein VFV88_11465, partial [Steroidobacteraceae bacterium]|nr:hypothetical protein [Steroidobacteraceae bacterium]